MAVVMTIVRCKYDLLFMRFNLSIWCEYLCQMRTQTFILPPEIGMEDSTLESWLKDRKIINEGEFFRIERRSIDARKKQIKINLELSIDPTRFATH